MICPHDNQPCTMDGSNSCREKCLVIQRQEDQEAREHKAVSDPMRFAGIRKILDEASQDFQKGDRWAIVQIIRLTGWEAPK